MSPVDPTYPLYPIACILSVAGLSLVLLTSFIRQSYNLGVTFLCFWLLLENATGAFNTIAWSDNADIKFIVYCDIVSHLQCICAVVKPMATLIITRRLALIASLRTVELPSKKERRRELVIDGILGLFLPLLATGLYVIVQNARFAVVEGSGCLNSPLVSGAGILITMSWYILPPLISTFIYCPKVLLIFYRQWRDVNRFLRSNGSVSHGIYFRILALAGIDILLTLPIGIVNLVLAISIGTVKPGVLLFYPGWNTVHADWSPTSVSYADSGANSAQNYFAIWTSPVLSFVIFGLFGLTSEARNSYWRIILAVGASFGWKPTPRTHGRSTLGTMEFGSVVRDGTLDDAESQTHEGSANSALTTEIKHFEGGSHSLGIYKNEPSRNANQDVPHAESESSASESS